MSTWYNGDQLPVWAHVAVGVCGKEHLHGAPSAAHTTVAPKSCGPQGLRSWTALPYIILSEKTWYFQLSALRYLLGVKYDRSYCNWF